jgi:hypothetical protein
VAQRGLFTTRSLWVTPHVDSQMYPAGQYVFQSRRDTGLAEWAREVRARGVGAVGCGHSQCAGKRDCWGCAWYPQGVHLEGRNDVA